MIFETNGKTSLTEGGEGIIYEHNGKLIKIYKPCVNIQSKKEKVEALLKLSLPKEAVTPKEIVTDRQGNFIGFVMDKIDGEEIKKIADKKFVALRRLSTKDILELLSKILKTIQYLHGQGIYIGDLNDKNILFNDKLNIFIIDCDSWSIGQNKCETAMELFKDPNLIGNNFNEGTDYYAFSVLAWKILTRVHPFGGTSNPDMDILERIEKKITIIDNPLVTIPRMVKYWNNLSPSFVSTLNSIFTTANRNIGDVVFDNLSKMKYCSVDKDYYYSDYSCCPICDKNAKIRSKPKSEGTVNGLNILELLSTNEINIIIDENIYLNNDNKIVNARDNKKYEYSAMYRYNFTTNGILIKDNNTSIEVCGKENYKFDKQYESNVVVNNESIYYISRQNNLVKLQPREDGNHISKICRCSTKSYLQVIDDKYFVVNCYPNLLLVNVNGMNCEIKYSDIVVNYGIHYDVISDKWLLIIEDSKGKYHLYIFNKNNIEYQTSEIKFTCKLSGISFNGETIFIPVDEKIRAFSYKKYLFKDFDCSTVDGDSKLIKRKNKFIIINEKNIYQFG